MPCRNQCRAPFRLYGKPCDFCAAEYETHMDESYRYYQRKKAIAAFRVWLRSLAADWEDPGQAVLVVPTQEPRPTYANTTYTNSITEEQFPWE